MYVAKYWRNKQLRYRLIKVMEQRKSAREVAVRGPAEKESRRALADEKRVKALS